MWLLFNIVFGDAYAGAGKVLTIYVWASVFVFMGVAQTLWNINENLQRIIWLRTAACAVLNVILNLILIPKYGVLGAASSSLVSHAFISYFSNLLSKETHVMFKLQSRALVLGWGSSRVRK
jgi:polysaccharide transporter, PST family